MDGALVCNRCLMVLKDARSASMRISLPRKTYSDAERQEALRRLLLMMSRLSHAGTWLNKNQSDVWWNRP
jgi:hypothetical protein